ncbi:MAG: pirin family protein [Bacteroidia bacterium]
MQKQTATREQVAPGFVIRRALPLGRKQQVGPFLLLDQMGPRTLNAGEGQGIPPHPHRGFETITYMISGAVEHHDSLGNKGVVRSGEVQWMTAGSGVIHAEYIAPEMKAEGGILHGFQIWVNLPRKDKLVKPSYQQFADHEFPIQEKDGVRLKLIAGTFGQWSSPIVTRTPLTVIHLQLDAGASFNVPLETGFEMAAYIADGEIEMNGEVFADGQVLFTTDEKELRIQAKKAAHVLILGGEPIDEPIVSYGPFVMNEEHEIREAILDYQQGKFGTIPV